MPGLRRHRRQQMIAMQSGIVDQHVEPTIGIHNRGNRQLPGLRIGHIQIHQPTAPGKLHCQCLRRPTLGTHAQPDATLRILFQEIPPDPSPQSAISACDQDASHTRSVATTDS